jgi:4-hydroxy-tetrahydrodipicolinate reductase
MRALLVGAGRMGKAIEVALVQRGHVVAGRIGREEKISDFFEREEGNGIGYGCDVAFEFTAPASAPAVVPLLLSQKCAVVSGTTGWDIASAAKMAREQGVPFLHSSNFSLGVAALRRAVVVVAAALAPFPEFEPGIVERHHAAKKDAPSGTARVLALDISRESLSKKSVPIVSLRQGAQPGEHSVFFEGADETVELVHRARSRSIFAQGAVVAAEWMIVSGRVGPVTFDEFFDDLSLKGGAS